MAEVKKFEMGTVIFKEGQWEMSMYDIVSGKVGIYASFGTADEKLLTELSAGQFFGEMGLVEAMPRSATAVALEDTETKMIRNDDLSDYFRESPDKIISILQNLSHRLRELSVEYLDACRAITEYVEAEEQKKPKKSSLKEKIQRLINFGEEYAALYTEMIQNDPTLLSSEFMGWY